VGSSDKLVNCSRITGLVSVSSKSLITISNVPNGSSYNGWPVVTFKIATLNYVFDTLPSPNVWIVNKLSLYCEIIYGVYAWLYEPYLISDNDPVTVTTEPTVSGKNLLTYNFVGPYGSVDNTYGKYLVESDEVSEK